MRLGDEQLDIEETEEIENKHHLEIEEVKEIENKHQFYSDFFNIYK